ncbi:MAG: hypothetical protein J0M02_18910, partial [Planctomycetes bacterium]|nr:hypothetical protein [Planctomycetota bacterium]
WADARIAGVRMRFRWCPGGQPPAQGWRGRPLAAEDPLPGMWVAASLLNVEQARALGAKVKTTASPQAAFACKAAEARELITALQVRLQAATGLPTVRQWGRIWADGAARTPDVPLFAHQTLWSLDASSSSPETSRPCAIWPANAWGMHDTWAESEWIDGGEGPATNATGGDFARDYPDILCRQNQLQHTLTHLRLPLRPIIAVP